MKYTLLFFLALFFTGIPCLASGANSMLPPQLHLQVSPPSFSQADTLQITLTVQLDSGWHINANKPGDEFSVPTRAVFKGQGLGFGPAQYPAPASKFLKVLNTNALLYEGVLVIKTNVWQSGRGSDLSSLTADLHYQACNHGICLRPAVTSIKLGASGSQPREVPDPGPSTVPASSGPVNFTGPLWLIVLSLLGFGLLLNLTPCVYPLIAVTISLFGAQAHKPFSFRFTMAALYALGLIISFSVLGVVSSLGGMLFGAALQSAAAQVTIGLIFIVLALSSFGLYDIRLPTGLMGRAAAASNTGGYFGGLLGGIFAGVLAAPCIGPIVLALIIHVAQKGSIVTGIWMFSAMALGLSLPYIILGISTGLLSRLPKSGNWMLDIKKILGLVLLGLANYYLRGLVGQRVHEVILGILLVYGGMYINPFVWPAGLSKTFGTFIRTMALLAVLYGLAYIFSPYMPGEFSQQNTSRISVSNTGSSPLIWGNYSDSAFQEAAVEGRPILLDFESRIWCAACREMEEKTYNNPEVKIALEDFVLLKIDVDKHPRRKSLLEEYEVVGIPTAIIIDGAGSEVDRIVGFLAPEPFITRLQKALVRQL